MSAAPPEPIPPSRAFGIAAAALLADVAFLRALWARPGHWGIWDWDFGLALFEAARKTVVDYGEFPVWNPWMGGGGTLVGNPLASTYAPSFLPILLFGTLPGVKLVLLLYTWIAQIGTFRLARAGSLGIPASILAALVFSFGGVFAQHFTHGHIGWIGYAWLPFLLLAFQRASAPGEIGARRSRHLAAGAVFLALAFLDGGPYHYVLVPAFLASAALVFALEARSVRPLATLPVVGVLGVGLAALEILPIAEMVTRFPRPTVVEDHYYGVPFEPTVGRVLFQALLSPAQAHDAQRWQPFFLNVGAYVGLFPILLAFTALALRPRRAWPWAALTVGWGLVCLGGTLPVAIDPWLLLHRLPGMDSLQIPMRFRVLPLFTLAMLCAHGLEAVGAIGRLGRARRVVPPLLVGVIGLDLMLVNGAVFRSAFVVPPIPIEERKTLRYELNRPYREIYRETARVPIFPNWPTGVFPAVRANEGTILESWPAEWPRATLPKSHPAHPGVEAFAVAGASRVSSFARTPNRMVLEVAGAGGTLAVNQNHHPGWLASPGTVVSWQGLLGVEVPAGVHTIVLRFRPPFFLAGLGISALVAVAVAWLGRRR